VSPSLTRFTTAFLLSSEVEQWSCQLGKAAVQVRTSRKRS